MLDMMMIDYYYFNVPVAACTPRLNQDNGLKISLLPHDSVLAR